MWRPLRQFALLLIVLCLAATPSPAAEPPLATVEIAPGIYVHHGVQEEAGPANDDAIANIGFIVGDASVMVIDPGGSAAEGRALRAAVRAVTDRPIRYVVLTHVHPDHIFGAAAFKADGAEIVGHARLPGALAQRGEYYVKTLRRSLGAAAEGSEVPLPTRLVESTAEFDLGDRPVEVRAHGTAHTDNDLSLFDRKTGTLWLSDLLFVERVPVVDGSLLGWLRELDGLKRVAAARAVPGHGPSAVDWPAAAAPEERYLRALLDGTRAALKAGIDIGAAADRVAQDERAHWLLFDEYHPRNVITTYKELEWE